MQNRLFIFFLHFWHLHLNKYKHVVNQTKLPARDIQPEGGQQLGGLELPVTWGVWLDIKLGRVWGISHQETSLQAKELGLPFVAFEGRGCH